MATQTHLVLIDGVYHYRRRIPKDLLKVYAPKLEKKFSFNTKDKREAERKARIESVKDDQEFSIHRQQLEQVDQIHTLSNEDIAKLSQEFIYEILSGDDGHRLDGSIDVGYLESIDMASELFKEGYAEGLPQNVAYIVDPHTQTAQFKRT